MPALSLLSSHWQLSFMAWCRNWSEMKQLFKKVKMITEYFPDITLWTTASKLPFLSSAVPVCIPPFLPLTPSSVSDWNSSA